MKNSFKVLLLFLLIIIPFSGCDKGTEPVTEPLLLTLTPSHVSEYGGADGAIDLMVRGGTYPYSYKWSTGDSTEDIANLTVGIYSVTVTDSDNATKTDSVEVICLEKPDLLDKLKGLSDITFREITPRYGYNREFVIDIIQPVDHNSHGGQTFKQRIYLLHQDESVPIRAQIEPFDHLAPEGLDPVHVVGLNVEEKARDEIVDSRSYDFAVAPTLSPAGYHVIALGQLVQQFRDILFGV